VPAGVTSHRSGRRRTCVLQGHDPLQHHELSIVDRFRNAVGTPTLGGLFGNNVVVGSTGC
jgi:hypothetical protein